MGIVRTLLLECILAFKEQTNLLGPPGYKLTPKPTLLYYQHGSVNAVYKFTNVASAFTTAVSRQPSGYGTPFMAAGCSYVFM